MNRHTWSWIGALGVLAGGALLVWTISPLSAQSGSRVPVRSSPQGTIQRTPPGSGTQSGSPTQQGGAQRPARTASTEPFEVRLWNWLQQAQYRNWGPLPGRPADAYAGQEPHGAMVKIFANRTAAGSPDALPHGSIIVKENYGADGQSLMAVTVMYRVQNFDPEHGDWYWAKYEPNGQVSRMEGMAVAGKVGMCIDCHGSAGGNDYAFANDR